MRTENIPLGQFRVFLGMKNQSPGQGGKSMSAAARQIANDPIFKRGFGEVIDQYLQDSTRLSYPLITGTMQMAFDSTGHVSDELMLAQLTGLLNRCKNDPSDSFAVTTVEASVCIRWEGGWLVIGGYTPELNGNPWTLHEAVDHYISLRSNVDPTFAQQNQPALDELRSVGIQVCVQYAHNMLGVETTAGQAGGQPKRSSV